jgi:hypothetical protein
MFRYHTASHAIKLKNAMGKSISFFSNSFVVLALWVTGYSWQLAAGNEYVGDGSQRSRDRRQMLQTTEYRTAQQGTAE